MATAYTSILKLALPVQGELSGTWGDVVNDNITSMVEEAIAGRAVINTWTTNSHTLTSADGTTSESRCAMLEFTDTGTSLTGDATVICPAQSKIYICKNDAGQKVTIKTSAGTGVDIADGQTMFVFCDGTNVVEAVTSMSSLKLGTAATSVEVTAVLDEDDLVSDSATALATQQSIKAYVDAQVTAQDLDFGGDSGTGSVDLDSQTFTIAGTSNEIETSASGQTLTVGLPAAVTVTTSVTTPLVQTTNVNANDGSSAIAIADSTGQTTINDAVLTTADINAGTIDNTTIGATTASTGAFTTVTSSGNTTVSGQLITDTIAEETATAGVTVDGVLLKDGGATLTGDLTVDTDTLYVDSTNNNVGIGLTNPTSHNANAVTLQVDGGTNGSELRLTNDTTGTASSNGFHIATVGNKAYLVQNEADDLYFYANGAEVLRMNSSQQSIFGASANRQILVNTTDNTNATDATLILQNNTQASTHGKLFIASGTTTPTQNLGLGFVGFGDANKVPNAFIGVYDDGATWTTGSDMPTRMAFWTTADGAASATERMRITNAGIVTIGGYGDADNSDSLLELREDNVGGLGAVLSIHNNSGASAGSQSAIYFGRTGTADRRSAIINTAGTYGQYNELSFETNNVEAMRIDSSQRVLIGATSNTAIGGHNAATQIVGSGSYHEATLTIQGNENNSNGAYLGLSSSRGTTAGSTTIVQDDDTLGQVYFAGADGTDLGSVAAAITAQVDGTPGANDMPGRLIFSTTADGSASLTERMRISQNGNVGINTTNPSKKFVVSNSSANGLEFSPDDAVTSTNRFISYNRSTSSFTPISYGASDHRFLIGDAEKVRIDTSGRVLIGEDTSVPIALNDSALYVGGTTTEKSQVGIARYANASSGPVLAFGKTRSSTNGSVGTIVQQDDFLGFIYFAGDDGTDLATRGALIVAEVDGTPGSNDMPGRLVFETTADGASSPTERMRIDNAGNVLVGTTSTSGFQTSSSETGTIVYAAGAIASTVSGDAPLYLNRLTSNGTILNLRKNGSTIGGISIKSRNSLVRPYIGNSNTRLLFDNTVDSIIPVNNDGDDRNAAISLGESGAAFKDLYLTGGIQFDSRSNKLDDYEEGTWTPQLGGTSGNPTVSFSVQDGYYVRVGNLVTTWMRLSISSISGGSGNANIYGLPFTQRNVSAMQANQGGMIDQVTSDCKQVSFQGDGNTTRYLIIKGGGSTGSHGGMSPAEFQASSDIRVCFTYQTT